MMKKTVFKSHRGHGYTHLVKPFKPAPGLSMADILTGMSDLSFQARSLGMAFDIWKKALQDEATIFLGLAGAMVPAGLRETVVHMIKNRYVDVIVSTGANLFHDLHETLGGQYYKCGPFEDDVALRKMKLDRMHDVVTSDEEFIELDKYIAEWATSLPKRPLTTREFFHRLGLHVQELTGKEGILSAAAKAGIPVYCPAFGDSSYAIALATLHPESRDIQFHTLKDVYETGMIAMRSRTTGVVFVGGGTPKNFTQQAWVTTEYLGVPEGGHKYCVQLTTDSPQWGGLSGCTFDESTSWGKIHFEATKIAVYADATISLPLLVQGLTDARPPIRRKAMPDFIQGENLQIIPPREAASARGRPASCWKQSAKQSSHKALHGAARRKNKQKVTV